MSAVSAPVVEHAEEGIVTLEVRRYGVAVLTIDDAREAHNAITTGFWAQLRAAIERIDEDASIAAAVLASGKADSFVVGASLDLLKSIKFATDAERIAREAAQVCRRLEGLRKPVVAAIRGRALGGGFELALACHAIVASDETETMLGLPEVRLGLVPAANGMLRAAQRAGLRAAIDLTLRGRELPPAAAKAMGLVDDVCPRAILLDAAARRAKSLVGHVPRLRDRPTDLKTFAVERNPVGRRLMFRRARERTLATTRGQYPAAERALDVLERFAAKGFDAAAELEAKAFGELMVSETAHRLIELFFATRSLSKDRGVDEKAEPRSVRQVAVIGGGLMGSGIAHASVGTGIPVRLKERDDAAAGRALRVVKELLDEGAMAGELTALQRDRAFARLSTTADFSGLRVADVVIEAVFEDLALKQEILREVEPLVRPTCVYASNASSLPIAKIAQPATSPERVLGMHYFSPVARMPLLEVVRADKTAAWAVATAVSLGKKQGKTVIVVKDGPGFYTTRVLAPMLCEAVQLVGEGVGIEAVDSAMAQWGFPLGPIQLLDEVGIDVGSQVAQVLHSAFGPRMTPPGSIAKLVADDRRGRKNGRGFYRYESPTQSDRPAAAPARGRKMVDAHVYALIGVEPRTRLPIEEIQMRCVLAMVNEAVRCFGDGVLRSARDGDVGAILGLGFPPFRGGPFRYVDTIGAAEVLRRVQGYADRFGERWKPAPLLVQMARRGETFFA